MVSLVMAAMLHVQNPCPVVRDCGPRDIGCAQPTKREVLYVTSR
jgi:hypothetical protein